MSSSGVVEWVGRDGIDRLGQAALLFRGGNFIVFQRADEHIGAVDVEHDDSLPRLDRDTPRYRRQWYDR